MTRWLRASDSKFDTDLDARPISGFEPRYTS
jgi:hypothetical protein